MPREHGDDGEFVETTRLEDVLGVFDVVDGPVILSADVADYLDCSRDTARRKLSQLYKRGDVDRRKVSRRVVYWKPDSDSTPEPVESHDPSPQPVATERRDPDPETETDPKTSTADTDALVEQVCIHMQGKPPRTSHGQDALLDVFALLQENGTMTTSELKETLWPVYRDHYSSERGMWDSLSRYLKDVPGVQKAGYGEWGYSGDDARKELDV